MAPNPNFIRQRNIAMTSAEIGVFFVTLIMTS